MILQIKADDIRNSDYCSPDSCAITKALCRAGRPELIHTGMFIKDRIAGEYKAMLWSSGNLPELSELNKKVQAMYNGDTPIEDFEYEIAID